MKVAKPLTHHISNNFLLSKLALYAELTKPRLTMFVVLSAVFGALMAPDWSWFLLLKISFGGYLVTGCSNILNQILEIQTDKLMSRTEKRPLPSHRISTQEALILSAILGIIGLYTLFSIHSLSGWLGLLSMILYVLFYTPLKRISPLGVFIGAFPGAIPPMLGYISISNSFGLVPGLLFAVQFMWQFPHFWSIAWKCHEDYQKAGLKMLPLKGGKSVDNAFYIFLYTLFVIPVSYLVYHFKICGLSYLMTSIALGLYFSYHAWLLYKHKDDQKALRLMFTSFIYLPVIQVSMILDKL